MLHCWLQQTAPTPHGDPSASQLPLLLDAATEDELVVVDAEVVVEDDPEVVVVVVDGPDPVVEAATSVVVEPLATLAPPCPPAPLPAALSLKRSAPDRPHAARESALATMGARRSRGREAGIVKESVAKNWPADKGALHESRRSGRIATGDDAREGRVLDEKTLQSRGKCSAIQGSQTGGTRVVSR